MRIENDTPLRRGYRLLRGAAIACMVTPFLAQATLAADRWEEAGSGAVAILPEPAQANGVTGGSLACAEQRWSLRLRLDAAAAPQLGKEGVVTAGEDRFTVPVASDGTVATLDLPYDALEGLKNGTRMIVALAEGKKPAGATFSLRNSKKVIEAIAPRCSQIDMTGYDRLAFEDIGIAVEEARPLVAEDVAEFREATTTEPKIAAGRLDLPEGRALLYASLCGSTWYYGASGCTVIIHARAQAGGAWQQALSSEGVALYVDRANSNGGMPNLVTLPLVNGLEPLNWVWTGQAYELREQVLAEQDPVPAEAEGDANP